MESNVQAHDESAAVAPVLDVLVVEDDAAIREALVRALDKAKLRARAVSGIEAARRVLDQARAVLLDIRLRDGDGLAFLEELRKRRPALPVVMATAYGDSERAIAAMRLGAFDYLTKPFDLTLLVATLRRALDVPAVAAAPELSAPSASLVGASAKMLDVWKAIGRAAACDASVLITGESGTGKELVARAIHDHSARKRAPFVAVNVAALAPTLFESELFGHEKGAFTGASERRIGRFELAAQGTLFLDELGELESSLQSKLLRVLQEGQLERVGGSTPIRARPRVIAATSRAVGPGVDDSPLRIDLFYRLAVLPIAIPPLRERKSDIPLLVEAFFRRDPTRKRALSEAAMQRLIECAWPGNVRELLHVLERAAVMSSADVLDAGDLALPAQRAAAPREDDLDLQRNVRALERSLVERALLSAAGNRSEAARLLGIARTQLYSKLRDLGIAEPQR